MNSGEADGNHVIVSSPYYARVRINWQLASQNVGGNYSTINWQAYTDFVGCDAQLDNGYASSANVGTLWANGGRVYNYSGNFSNHTVTMATGTFNVGHDSNGNCTLQMGSAIVVYQSGTSTAAGSWNLPQIPRYANITSFTASSPTDQGFELFANTDVNANISFSIDGGASYSGGGSGTGANQTFSNLISGHTYVCYVQAQNQASGLLSYAGPIDLTTLVQNNFFGRRVL